MEFFPNTRRPQSRSKPRVSLESAEATHFASLSPLGTKHLGYSLHLVLSLLRLFSTYVDPASSFLFATSRLGLPTALIYLKGASHVNIEMNKMKENHLYLGCPVYSNLLAPPCGFDAKREGDGRAKETSRETPQAVPDLLRIEVTRSRETWSALLTRHQIAACIFYIIYPAFLSLRS